MYQSLIDLVQSFPHAPGVYRMYGADDLLLYVGKARDLYRRVRSYFTGQNGPRIESMISQVRRIEITVTASEEEALLLESSLIKSLLPRYNIVFRDGKTYPYIRMSQHEWPRVSFYRGGVQKGASFYGPYPSAETVKKTIAIVQKLFKIRTCNDQVFSSVQRPCLLYQMNRCTAPCVGYVSSEEYRQQCHEAMLFLSGKNRYLIKHLKKRMMLYAEELAYEKAEEIHQLLQSLSKIHLDQHVLTNTETVADVIGVSLVESSACISVVQVRDGNIVHQYNLLSDQWVSVSGDVIDDPLVVIAYLSQQVQYRSFCGTIIVPPSCEEVVQESSLYAPKAVIKRPVRTHELAWSSLAMENARLTLIRHAGSFAYRFHKMCSFFDLMQSCTVLCIDISHTQGQETVAACIVFTDQGMNKQSSKQYDFGDQYGGDDCSAICGALRMFYDEYQEMNVPHMVLIDGGSQQVDAAYQYLSCRLDKMPLLLGIAKGEGRKVGLETLVYPRLLQKSPLVLGVTNPVLLALAHIRDHAHGFALKHHRRLREDVSLMTEWLALPGVGRVRAQRLFDHFGSMVRLRAASIDQISSIKGISVAVARDIYHTLHAS